MKITIITASFNSEKTISDCVRSINSQTYEQVEHIVVDGGSSDRTVDLVKKLSQRDLLIQSEPDDGIYDALNKGIKLSSGDIIGFLHSDDVLANVDVIAEVARAFLDTRVSAVYGDLDYVSKNDVSRIVRRWKSSQQSRQHLYLGWMPPHPTLYLRKDVYTKIGGFDKSFQISADYLSVLKLFMCAGVAAKYIPVTIVKMRLGGVSNRSIKSIFIKTCEDVRALRLCGISLFFSVIIVIMKNLTKVPQFVAWKRVIGFH